MFSHPATFHGGAKDGQHTTIISEEPEPPAVLFVATDLEPHLQFVKSRYRCDAPGQYVFECLAR